MLCAKVVEPLCDDEVRLLQLMQHTLGCLGCEYPHYDRRRGPAPWDGSETLPCAMQDDGFWTNDPPHTSQTAAWQGMCASRCQTAPPCSEPSPVEVVVRTVVVHPTLVRPGGPRWAEYLI